MNSLNSIRRDAACYVSTCRISTWLCLFFFFTFTMQTVKAQTYSFGGGDGAVGNPYIIATVEHLAELATAIRNAGGDTNKEYLGMFFKLTNDLDLNVSPHNTGEGWLPIGLPGTGGFRGTLDGNGHVIRGLYINRNANRQGLFGCIMGTVRNLGIEGSVTVGGQSVGGLTGMLYGTGAKIENCYFAGEVKGVTASTQEIGGLVGQIDRGTINRCYSTASVTGDVAGNYYIGGLVGSMWSGYVTNSYATGDVTSVERSVGGLVGYVDTYSTNPAPEVSGCYATGNVTSTQGEVGGLVGRLQTGTIKNSYATGAVSGTADVGGIAGGLDANTGSSNITNCVALNPSVKESSNSGRDGRIIGNTDGATLNSNRAWDGMLQQGAVHVPTVKIVNQGGTFRLTIDDVETPIRGVRGEVKLDVAAQIGANACTIWDTYVPYVPGVIAEANQNNLYVMRGFYLSHDGAAYTENYKQTKKNEILTQVRTLKDFPNILMWALGNELDHGSSTANIPAVWQFINEIATEIKAIDSRHLVTTVMCYDINNGFKNVSQYCPALDVLCINTYEGIADTDNGFVKSNWKGAYFISEYGPDGSWAVTKTSWGAPIEASSEQKRVWYENRYNSYIKNKPRCLGGFPFVWGCWIDEWTPTWYSMFVQSGVAGLPLNGEKTPMVEAMERVYKGVEPTQTAPKVTDIYINNTKPLGSFLGYEYSNNISVNAGATFTGKVDATDKEGNTLTYVWEILLESQSPSSRTRVGTVQTTTGNTMTTSVSTKGNYRLYVYVLDGTGYVGTANAPFQVK